MGNCSIISEWRKYIFIKSPVHKKNACGQALGLDESSITRKQNLVCEAHFKPNSYVTRYDGKKILLKSSVPSLYLSKDSIDQTKIEEVESETKIDKIIPDSGPDPAVGRHSDNPGHQIDQSVGQSLTRRV